MSLNAKLQLGFMLLVGIAIGMYTSGIFQVVISTILISIVAYLKYAKVMKEGFAAVWIFLLSVFCISGILFGNILLFVSNHISIHWKGIEMMELVTFIGQDVSHVLGTLFVIGALSGFVISIGKAIGYAVHGVKNEDWKEIKC